MTPPRVLVVDDNPLNLEIARVLLAHAGFEVHTAGDATTAMDLWRRLPPRIVLMDIQMPGEDGVALAQRMRSEPCGRAGGGLDDPPARLVAFTAYAMKGDRERLLAAGLDGYIAKPIDVAQFASQVRALLDAADTPPAN